MSEHPPPPYGQSPFGPGPHLLSPDHLQATTVLVTGVVAVAACQFLGPVALVMGTGGREVTHG